MLILFLLYLNNVILDFLLPALVENELLFTLEMLRVIFFENIFFKLVLPILMIHQSKTTLPFLWIDQDFDRKKSFFMTKQDILPRTNDIKLTAKTEELQKNRGMKPELVPPVPIPVITVVMHSEHSKRLTCAKYLYI